MSKIYILDTNVLIHNPQAMFVFEENEVVIPEAVLEELNKFKWEMDERGSDVRAVGRLLDELRKKGSLDKGIVLESGGILRIGLNHYRVKIPPYWDLKEADNRILQICKGLAASNKGKRVILVSKDVLLRIKAESLGVEAQDYINDRVEDSTYTGRAEVFVAKKALDDFYKEKKAIHRHEIFVFSKEGEQQFAELEVNQFLTVKALDSPRQTALARFDGKEAVPLKYFKEDMVVYGLKPKSVGQKFLLEALLAPAEVAPLVISKGVAGTGKTLWAVAAGLHNVMDGPKNYRRVLIVRPNTTMDEQIGFLPGDEQAKIDPLMRPVYDNLEVILDSDEKHRYDDEKDLRDKIEEIFERKYIVTESIGYMRGRSLAKLMVIIDEAQNLTPRQAKGLITRVGNGTKIVMLGDPFQIDRPMLDSHSNGLSYASERMRGSRLCWQITLNEDEAERSDLATEGAVRL